MVRKPGVFKNQKYDYSNAVRIGDLFHEEFIDKLPLGKHPNRGYAEKKRRKVQSIFFQFLEILQEHLIETGDKYVFPTYPNALIYICEKTQLDVTRIRKNRQIYKKVNPVLSDGKYYQFVYYCPKVRYRKRWIRIQKVKYDQIIDRVNKGQRYFHR